MQSSSVNEREKPVVLVTGGAGYIGSHMVLALSEAGYHPVVIDDLSNGHADAVLAGDFFHGSIADADLLARVMTQYPIQAVFHFAGKIVVGESVSDPALYYQENITSGLALLNAMCTHGVSTLIFSSTAAVYGVPQSEALAETHPQHPLSPYGRSKWMFEQILADYAAAYGLRYGCLRYFNAAGADPQARLGERHHPETHLIPLLLEVAAGERPDIQVFGNDYPTSDGSCIRDYIHVHDLCTAHLQLLAYLQRGGRSAAFNLGTGKGYSVLEVIKVVERVTGVVIPWRVALRRDGDAAVLVADGRKAMDELGWSPVYSDLEQIVTHAWRYKCYQFN